MAFHGKPSSVLDVSSISANIKIGIKVAFSLFFSNVSIMESDSVLIFLRKGTIKHMELNQCGGMK